MADRASDVPTGAPDEAYPDDGRDAPESDREQAETARAATSSTSRSSAPRTSPSRTGAESRRAPASPSPLFPRASILALVGGSHSDISGFAVGQTVASALVLTLLAWKKQSIAFRVGSRALRADSVLTAAAALLAAITLAGLLLNDTLGWWWADPVVALAIAAFLLREGYGIFHLSD
jgi:hypothetical protein